MDDDLAEKLRADLDVALREAGPNVGIAFGEALFREFRRRGWFTLETFGVIGTTLFATKLPAYARSHYVFATWDVPDDEFKVGSDASQGQ